MIKTLQILLCYTIAFLSTHTTHAQLGVFEVCGDFEVLSTSTYDAELAASTGAGIGFDQVSIAGDLTLDGTLDIGLSGYTPDEDDTFTLMTYTGTLSGSFASIDWPADMIAQGWEIDYGTLYPGTVTIYVPSVLPVEFLAFNVKADANAHLLTWTTGSEFNNNRFDIEYSTDGRSFIEVGVVYSTGNSLLSQGYDYSYTPATSVTHYYRLKQVDYDGRFSYSDIISIFNNATQDLSFYPNPSSGVVTFKEVVNGILVYDLLGKQVLDSGNTSMSYDLSMLTSGSYFLRVKGQSDQITRLVINQ